MGFTNLSRPRPCILQIRHNCWCALSFLQAVEGEKSRDQMRGGKRPDGVTVLAQKGSNPFKNRGYLLLLVGLTNEYATLGQGIGNGLLLVLAGVLFARGCFIFGFVLSLGPLPSCSLYPFFQPQKSWTLFLTSHLY
jgi:hypothetical protein